MNSIAQDVVACTQCSELREYCAQVGVTKKRAYRDWEYWAKPVPAFGDPRARVLIVGLAPGAHGSNRTGRMFTGDGSGDWLYRALHRAGFANMPEARHIEDGLELRDAMITAVARCAPPKNKPTPLQLRRCAPFLEREFDALPRLRVVVALGAVAFHGAKRLLHEKGFRFSAQAVEFAHGAEFCASDAGRRTRTLLASYHPSRQNTNTGKLTAPMLDAIFARAAELRAGPERQAELA